jgi:hypothetical protein
MWEPLDTLLGQDGIVGLKTGSTQAAGGCVLIAAWQKASGCKTLIAAAAFGQPDTAETNSAERICKPATTLCLPWIAPSALARARCAKVGRTHPRTASSVSASEINAARHDHLAGRLRGRSGGSAAAWRRPRRAGG